MPPKNWVFAAPQNDDSPMPEFRLGFDYHERLLELVVLVFDSGVEPEVASWGRLPATLHWPVRWLLG